MYPTVRSPMRHIIFFGETGSGKSSVINLLLGANSARVSNDSRPCTQVSTCYETPLYCGRKYCLWDTRGLGEARNFFQAILGWGSEKELKKLLKERHRSRQIDLLVYCVQGSRTTGALVKNYEAFCAISRRLAAPVAIVVTRLEGEVNMDDWWRNNASALSRLGLNFDDHACVTTVQGPHLDESRKKLMGLIARRYNWEPKENGSYFGSPVPIPTRPAPPHHENPMVWNYLKSKYKPKGNLDDESLHPQRQRIDSGHSTTSSAPPTPIVVPPTPRTAITPMDIPSINSNLSQSSSDNVSSVEPSPCSTPLTSSLSSRSSQSDSFTEEIKSFLNNLSIKNLTSTVERRNNFPTHGGSFGDVWECDLLSGGSRHKVAVKAVKTKPEEIENHLKKLRRELRIWCGLNHRNVVPLLGVVSGFGHLPSMVSMWFSNGSLHKYLADHPMLHPSKRRHLLRDIADGLSYLHSEGIIHGDLHSDNVLIDGDGTACLTDFGLSLVEDFVRTSYLRSSICGTVVFADPALVKRSFDSLRDIVIYPTKACDVYSFGGLMLHVLSGKRPYAEIHTTPVLLNNVLSGIRPQIPNNITPQDELLIKSCWDCDERNRPSADRLLTMFA